MTDLCDGSLLVVFDDEGHRKSREWTPMTFPLEQNQSVLAMMRTEELCP